MQQKARKRMPGCEARGVQGCATRGFNQYLRAAGKDLESFRNRLKETHLPEELQSKAETFLVQTVHALDVTEKKQMYRRELIGMEEKVKETAEQIEELLKSMRELGV